MSLRPIDKHVNRVTKYSINTDIRSKEVQL